MNRQPSPSLIAIAGHAIRLNDVRGLLVENDRRVVILRNGMKLVVSKPDGELLQRALNRQKILIEVATK